MFVDDGILLAQPELISDHSMFLLDTCDNGPRPFIWANNQVYMSLRSKVLACTKKYDGQTDIPNLLVYAPFGLGPKNLNWVKWVSDNKRWHHKHTEK